MYTLLVLLRSSICGSLSLSADKNSMPESLRCCLLNLAVVSTLSLQTPLIMRLSISSLCLILLSKNLFHAEAHPVRTILSSTQPAQQFAIRIISIRQLSDNEPAATSVYTTPTSAVLTPQPGQARNKSCHPGPGGGLHPPPAPPSLPFNAGECS